MKFALQRAKTLQAAKIAGTTQLRKVESVPEDDGMYRPSKWMLPVLLLVSGIRAVAYKMRRCVDPSFPEDRVLFEYQMQVPAARTADSIRTGASVAVAEQREREMTSSRNCGPPREAPGHDARASERDNGESASAAGTGITGTSDAVLPAHFDARSRRPSTSSAVQPGKGKTGKPPPHKSHSRQGGQRVHNKGKVVPSHSADPLVPVSETVKRSSVHDGQAASGQGASGPDRRRTMSVTRTALTSSSTTLVSVPSSSSVHSAPAGSLIHASSGASARKTVSWIDGQTVHEPGQQQPDAYV